MGNGNTPGSYYHYLDENHTSLPCKINSIPGDGKKNFWKLLKKNWF